MTESRYDLIVIGAGPGGYVAAIRAAQLGMKVAVVDRRAVPGGVCLNEGCIPSKTLLDTSEFFAKIRRDAASHGISVDNPTLDVKSMMTRKNDVIGKLADGILYLFKKHGVTWINGVAAIKDPDATGRHRVAVSRPMKQEAAESGDLAETQSAEERMLLAPRVILATGSEAVLLPAIAFDGNVVVTAREALSFETCPEHLVIAGGNYIGLEVGSIWSRLGARVTIIEALNRLAPAMDRQVADVLYRSLRKQGVEFKLGARISGVRRIGSRAIVQYTAGAGTEELDCDKVLLAVGRRPITEGFGLELLGVQCDNDGKIVVNEDYQTTVKGLYAVGDVIPGPMLAHKASAEAVACVERMKGRTSIVEYEIISGSVFTDPEAAFVGATENQLKERAEPYRVGRFNFSASGRARSFGETEGFVKILAHEETDRILGVHICGPRASDLIAEAVSVMSFGGTARDIALTCHAHPTFAEALREAALDVHGESAHA